MDGTSRNNKKGGELNRLSTFFRNIRFYADITIELMKGRLVSARLSTQSKDVQVYDPLLPRPKIIISEDQFTIMKVTMEELKSVPTFSSEPYSITNEKVQAYLKKNST